MDSNITSGNLYNASSQRLVIRVAKHSLSFLKPTPEGQLVHFPYTTKSGMSPAANVRVAFREHDVLVKDTSRVLLSLVSPVLLMPIDEFMDNENLDMTALYNHPFTGHEHEEVVHSVLPDLSAVAIFAINKDVKLVATDNFNDVRIQNVMQPVWSHLYQRSLLVPQRRKLYGYFHDGLLDIFSFQQHRFRYSNTYEVAHAHDAMYYLLFAFKQLALDAEADEIHLVGEMPHGEWLLAKLRQFVKRVYTLNPVADLNRSEASRIKNLEFDMMLCE